MAMLAERKKREKWCLNPRGNAWSDDQTKFGQRLLEKMGWSAGQGLGINNQGPTEIVKVKKKDDSKGLGFKENGEEWLKTTSDYNELLDQLGGSSIEGSEHSNPTSSLEDRSKKSKARVHYHKFTRGKDLSRYSKKDLASIIGPDVVKSKNNDDLTLDYTSNQVNKGSSVDYFSSKNQQEEHNTSEEPVVESKKNKKSVEDLQQHEAQQLVTELESTKIESKKKKKKNKSDALALDYEKEIEESTFLNDEDVNINVLNKKKKRKEVAEEVDEHIEENQLEEKTYSFKDSDGCDVKNKKKKKQFENLSSLQSNSKENNEINTTGGESVMESSNYDENTFLNNEDTTRNVLKKKKKRKEVDETWSVDQNTEGNELEEKSYSFKYSDGSDVRKKKKKKRFENLSSSQSISQENNEINTTVGEIVMDSSNQFVDSIEIDNPKASKEGKKETKKRKLKENLENEIFVDNTTVSEKKKKFSVDNDKSEEQEEIPCVKSEKRSKKKKSTNEWNNLDESKNYEIQVSHKISKVKSVDAEGRISETVPIETNEEEALIKLKKEDKKNKKKIVTEKVKSYDQLLREESSATSNQVNCVESKECLEVLGRKTRLRNINIPKKPAQHTRFETQDFMSFSPSTENKKICNYSGETRHSNFTSNTNWSVVKEYIEPSQQELDMIKGVVIYEYRLLTNKLKELNLSVPEMKFIIKDKTLAQATCRKLKQLRKSKQIKAMLPEDHVEEVEAAVKKYAEALKPKVEKFKTLAEIEKVAVQIAGELPDEPSNKADLSIILGSEKTEVIKKMSKQLKVLLREKSSGLGSHNNEQINTVELKENDDSAELISVNPKVKLHSHEINRQTSDVKNISTNDVPQNQSLQARIENRLKELAEQMKLLKKGRKPTITPTMLPKVKTRNWETFSTENKPLRKSSGLVSGNDDSFDNGQSRPRLEKYRPFDIPSLSGRGFVRGSIPRGGWGPLRSFGMGLQGRGAFVRGRTFRGFGRGESLRGRGRISQNNFDAKLYAEKCKKSNKVPEIVFKGVDLKVISGYAANKTVETGQSELTLSADLVKSPCQFTEVVVHKEQVNSCIVDLVES